MPPADPTRLSLAEAAEQIRRRALSATELTRGYLERIARRDGELRAYLTVLDSEALAAAAAADREIAGGSYRGPLHGIPIALKDLVMTRGVRTTCGGRILKDWVPEADATVAMRLGEAGAILLGKLNMHEFAYGPTGVNAVYGTPRNPWDGARMPGGSSSGSGVAVAAALAAGALGTDTGGSIRIPAAFCGIVGLKPTYGRVSRAGVIPLAWSLDHVGPMTRTVTDAALMLQVLAGRDAADPSTATRPVPDYQAALQGGDLRGVRLGIPRDFFFAHLEPEIREAVQATAERLEGQGAALEEVRLPHISLAGAASFAIMRAEATAYHEPYLRTRPGDYGADVRGRLMTGQFLPATQYLKGQRARQVLRAEVDAALARVHALLAPAAPLPAPPLDVREVAVEGVTQDVRLWITRYTAPFNVTGHPVLAVPCGLTAGGLPIGLQIIGRHFEEGTILRIGRAVEAQDPLGGRWPPLA
jgi:aspartyl-tRNA(Asn)/glutamyl-tRNA(Gln) amidotransferase subunit A